MESRPPCEHFQRSIASYLRSLAHCPSTLATEGTHTLRTVSAGVRSTRNEDGGIVLDIEHGEMFRLNPVGALILESLGKGCTETEIAQEISRQYSISEKTVVADVRDFVKSLEEHKLIQIHPGEKTS